MATAVRMMYEENTILKRIIDFASKFVTIIDDRTPRTSHLCDVAQRETFF